MIIMKILRSKSTQTFMRLTAIFMATIPILHKMFMLGIHKPIMLANGKVVLYLQFRQSQQ